MVAPKKMGLSSPSPVYGAAMAPVGWAHPDSPPPAASRTLGGTQVLAKAPGPLAHLAAVRTVWVHIVPNQLFPRSQFQEGVCLFKETCMHVMRQLQIFLCIESVRFGLMLLSSHSIDDGKPLV